MIKILWVFMGCLVSLYANAQQYEFNKEISGYASNPLYFQYSSGLAKITIDKFDNIFILDKEGRAVIKLDSNKRFVKKWFSADYANEEEVKKQNSHKLMGFLMFDFVKGIKADFEGNIYLFGYGEIYKFDTNGKLLLVISEVSDFEDIAFDRSGNIYGVTQGNIEKMDPMGMRLGYLEPKPVKFEEGQMPIMNSVVLDNENNVYVLDRGMGNIFKFNHKGKHIASFCKRGQGDGEILDAEGLAIDKNNNLYISDNTSWRVQCLDSKGKFKYRIGREDTTIDKIIYPHAVAVDSKGHIYIQSIYSGIVEYDANKNYVGTWGTDGAEDGCLIAPDEIFISKDNLIYIADEKKPCIQRYTIDGRFIDVFLKTVDLNGSSYRIEDMSEDEDNNIVLLTQQSEKPLLFVDRKGYYHMKYTSQDKDHFVMGKSLGVRRDDMNDYSENYFISNYRSGQVKKLDYGGNLIKKINSIDTSRGELPVSDFFLDNEGNVIVGFSGHSIQKFDKKGKFLNYLVRYDSTLNINRNFQSIAMDSNGYIYTLNNDCEVLVFNASGNLATKVKLKDKTTPCLNTDEKIAVTKDGKKIFVTDKMNYRVQIFNRQD